MRFLEAIDRADRSPEFRTVLRPYCILQFGDPEKRGTTLIRRLPSGAWDVFSLTALHGSGYTLGCFDSPREAVLAALEGTKQFRDFEILLLLPWSVIDGGRNDNSNEATGN